MTNCVTTTAYGRGLARTPKVASAQSTPEGVQVAAAPELLHTEEHNLSKINKPMPPAGLAPGWLPGWARGW